METAIIITASISNFSSCCMGGVAIMITEQQKKNRIKIAKSKAKIIRYLNENEMIVFFLLGLSILFMVGCLAVAVA